MGVGFIVIILLLAMLLGLFSRQVLAVVDETSETDTVPTVPTHTDDDQSQVI